jgi:hypothetical protein
MGITLCQQRISGSFVEGVSLHRGFIDHICDGALENQGRTKSATGNANDVFTKIPFIIGKGVLKLVIVIEVTMTKINAFSAEVFEWRR